MDVCFDIYLDSFLAPSFLQQRLEKRLNLVKLAEKTLGIIYQTCNCALPMDNADATERLDVRNWHTTWSWTLPKSDQISSTQIETPPKRAESRYMCGPLEICLPIFIISCLFTQNTIIGPGNWCLILFHCISGVTGFNVHCHRKKILMQKWEGKNSMDVGYSHTGNTDSDPVAKKMHNCGNQIRPIFVMVGAKCRIANIFKEEGRYEP